MAPGFRDPKLRILPYSPRGGSGPYISLGWGHCQDLLDLVCPAFLRGKRGGATGTELSWGKWEKRLFSPK